MAGPGRDSQTTLASLVTQVTKVPTYEAYNDEGTPNSVTTDSTYITPHTPSTPGTHLSNIPKTSSIANRNSANSPVGVGSTVGVSTTPAASSNNLLEVIIKSLTSCFTKSSTQTSVSTTNPPKPSTSTQPVLQKKPSTRVISQGLLPEQLPQHKGKKTLVLDLDETLVHSCFTHVPNSDFYIPIVIEGTKHTVYVLKRPFVDEFLTEMAKIYEIVIFTASVSLYANPLLDLLDPNRVITHRLFREHCTFVDGLYVKDLSKLGRDVDSTIIVDNSRVCYKFQPQNAMPSITWLEDKSDNQLVRMIPYLVRIKDEPRVYDVLKEFRESESNWSVNQW
ncbi:carboxy-terminal domain RNA polymerase II polypeptide A small phosphatase [Acrasis kona]|uniref:Carboxy-terminal domain RNA polymerase II polypeptide A small phosphatase n=1 Tax=Acrasis kona TaxID=1008807 RepID=A0AAW2YL88_9EUKA